MTTRESGGRVAILSGVRTPFVRAGSRFARVEAAMLARSAFVETLARSSVSPDQIDEVILGCAGQPPDAQNLARVAALRAGVPEHVPAVTVHRNCASGMEAVTEGALRIQAGRGSLFLVGGVEAMSKGLVMYPDSAAEWLAGLAKAKTLGQRLGHFLRFRPRFLKPRIGLMEALTDPVSGLIMGKTAEILAREFQIPREEQDEFALRSHEKALRAEQDGVFRDEIAPVLPDPQHPEVTEADNGAREGLTREKLAKLRPVFDRRHGTVTVGNACQLTDGAAALLLASEERAEQLGIQPLGYLNDFAYAGLDPARMGLGPVYATSKLLSQSSVRWEDFERIELNEAFAVQVLACRRAFASEEFAHRHLGRADPIGELPDEKLNVNGGAIALGHPVGATGIRLVLTLLHELARSDCRRGLATLCIGGGQGAALDLEAA